MIKPPENVSVVSGESIRLRCVVEGRPHPEVRWSRRNGRIPAGRARIDQDQATLILRDASPDDEDEYFCVAENRAGEVRSRAWVTVNCKYLLLFSPSCLHFSRSYLAKLVFGQVYLHGWKQYVEEGLNPAIFSECCSLFQLLEQTRGISSDFSVHISVAGWLRTPFVRGKRLAGGRPARDPSPNPTHINPAP